jgi:hypothetical protein
MSGMLVLLDHDTDRGNGFDGIRLDDVLIPINDEYPVLTDGKIRKLMVTFCIAIRISVRSFRSESCIITASFCAIQLESREN